MTTSLQTKKFLGLCCESLLSLGFVHLVPGWISMCFKLCFKCVLQSKRRVHHHATKERVNSDINIGRGTARKGIHAHGLIMQK